MAYRLELKPSAAKSLSKLPRAVQRAIAAVLEGLIENPRPRGVTKLAGAEDLYRVRAGDYRVVYTIRDQLLLVLVVRIAHRKEVYR
ncbi:MAG: type II toxin-antitoxin system RelE family toxin [Acidobacteriota bacterium]